MPQTHYRMQMQIDVTADPGQSFTLTEQDTTITTKTVHVSVEIMGPRGKGKPPHCQVHWHGYAEDSASNTTEVEEFETYIPGDYRKVSGNTIRTLPAGVVSTLREMAPQVVAEALAERPAKTKRH